MIKFLRYLVELIHRIMPKHHHAVIYGWPDFEDNSIALEQGLQDTELDEVVLLLSGSSQTVHFKLGPKTCCVRKSSAVGLWLFLTAKYVFFTHPCFVRRFPKDVVSVNVWHGMPIKRIGWMLNGNEGIASTHALATSPFWAEIMDRSMRPQLPCLSTGLPRNDRLFSDRSDVFARLELSDGQRLIVWLPTYRKSVRGELRQDGVELGNIFELPEANPESMNEFLASQNVVMLVKPHPMAAFDRNQVWSHLLIVDDQWLKDRSLSLYQTLGASDMLISDISSVVVDYLLLDRPIIHAFPDLKEYRSSRGFSVEPIEDYFCGPVVTNQTELLAALEVEFTGGDPDALKRRKMLELSHSHRDGNATERLIESIGL